MCHFKFELPYIMGEWCEKTWNGARNKRIPFFFMTICADERNGIAMTELALSAAEPFSSPAWGSNFVAFTSESGAAIPETLVKTYLNRACKYAKHYGVYLVPERFVLMNYHCMALISPKGEVLGAQKAAFINPANRIGKRAASLEVFHTEFGGLFLCVDVDIYHAEVCRCAAGMGAQIIVCSQYVTRAEYGSHIVVSGAWNVSQLNNVYTIAVSGQFNCLCAPIPISAHGDGFNVPPNLRLPMTARIHADKLSYVKAVPQLSRKFYAVHRAELLR